MKTGKQRILIVKLGSIGDVIHSLPVLCTLRTTFPESFIGWVVEEAAFPVLQGNQDLNELILLERKKLTGISSVSYINYWIRRLQEKDFDTVFDLHNLLKSGMISYFSGAPLRVGFRKMREGNFLFMNHRIKPSPHCRHAVEKYLNLLRALGVDESQWVKRFPLTWNNEDEAIVHRFMVDNQLHQGGALVAINPGANWSSKQWMPERYAKVADEIMKWFGVRVLILWGPGERSIAESLLNKMSRPGILSPQTTIKQLMALIHRCDLLISGDSAPVHIAAALKIPTVTLFGPSDPNRNAPYGDPHRIVASPIPPAGHLQRKEKGDVWMKAIEVDHVLEAARQQLEGIGKIAYSSPKY